MEKVIRKIVEQQNCNNSVEEIENKVFKYTEKIILEEYDFSKFNKEIYTKGKKKRNIYTFEPKSLEDVMSRYLKVKIDKLFNIKYTSRNKVINTLFNTLPLMDDLNDFVVIRADFKSFFESVQTKDVYNKYIKYSSMKRKDKGFFEDYVEAFEFCYAGLCLSNTLTEIICRDFDKNLRARLDEYGIVYCERYVDDILIILNRYIEKDDVIKSIELSIKEVFGTSPVKLHPKKFSYIARRKFEVGQIQEFNFLGYQFSISKKIIKNNKEYFEFQFGITKIKINKYYNRYKNIFIEYKKNNDIELLRQRLKICSTRIVIKRQVEETSYKWLTKGIVSNYNELRFHLDSLDKDTEKFLKEVYYTIMIELKIQIPYFLINSKEEVSIYNIYSSLKRNRSMVFERNIGIKKKDIERWFDKIDENYSAFNKSYDGIVADYFDKINIK